MGGPQLVHFAKDGTGPAIYLNEVRCLFYHPDFGNCPEAAEVVFVHINAEGGAGLHGWCMRHSPFGRTQ